MKRFHFPLRPVAVIRAHKELKAREALASAMHATAAALRKLECASLAAADLDRKILASRQRAIRPTEAAAFALDYRRACAEEAEMRNRHAEALKTESARRAECIEADRAVKIVTRLEEKARAGHRAGALLEEQKGLDEIAGFRALNRKAAS